jgi:type IX secretion system PorP/SprF family membrane protein
MNVGVLQAQYIPNSSQPFQYMPVYNPAFAGMDEFTDLRLGYRQHMTGFGGSAPKMLNAVINFRLRQPLDLVTHAMRSSNGEALRDANILPRRKRIIHGFGGNVYNEKVGLFNRLGAGVTYAFHYPLSKSVRLSLGTGVSVESRKLDTNGIDLGDNIADPFYNSLMQNGSNQSTLNVRAGFLLYSKSFYIGGSYLPLVNSAIGASDLSTPEAYYQATLQTGLSLQINDNFMVKPSVMGLMDLNNEFLIDYTVKGYLKEKAWAGLTYRSIKSTVLTVGFDFNPLIGVGYSYEMVMGDMKQFNSGSHEIVLALRLKNFKSLTPYAW